MSAQENEAVVRKLYEAMMSGGELETFLPFYAEDVLVHAPKGKSIVMGERRGRESMREAMAYIGERVTGFEVELLKLFADDEEVISVHRDKATRADGRSMNLRVCCRWIVRDGEIAELWEYPEEPSEVDEFFL
jgi:ketosteroid isomerase-like protein